MKANAAKNVDEYIASFPQDVQKSLPKIRSTIKKAAPGAEESISYQIPTFKLNGYLIYFAAYKNHIGLYPAPRGAKEFKKDLARHEGGKGTIRLRLDEPIPYDLISRIVTFRAKQNLDKANTKGKKRLSAQAIPPADRG